MPSHVNPSLSSAPRYFPIENGRYEVKPGLRRFSGNVFEIDRQYERYRQSKLAARAERLSKYIATSDLRPAVERAVCSFIVRRLPIEHPSHFSFDGKVLRSALTGDVLHFSPAGDYQRADSNAAPKFISGLDALAMQVQEDLAIMSTEHDRHWLGAVHLCSPNHWAAEDKIGKTFSAIHEPVAGIDAINERSNQWVNTMVNATDGLMRFAWGVATDDQLNHHPELAAGREFDRATPMAFLRVERQTMWGFPQVGACLFTIRTSFIDCAEVRACDPERVALVSAIQSMSPESLRYKGIAEFKTDLLEWLAS